MAQIALNRNTANLFFGHDSRPLTQLFSYIKLLCAAVIAVASISLLLAGVWYSLTHPIFLAIELCASAIIGASVTLAGAMPVLHPRRTQPKQTPSNFGIQNWEDVRFLTEDGIELGAWFIPPPRAGKHATLIFVHGLGGNRGDLLSQAAMLVSRGFGALLIDLRNHGKSDGQITTLGYAEADDVHGAFYYLLMRPEVDPDRIGLFGYSMGAATVLRAGVRLPQIRSIIAESAYSSLRENIVHGIISRTGLPPFPFAPLMIWLGELITGLCIDQIRPIDDMARLGSRAVLFIHGKKDRSVHVSNSVRLFNAAQGPRGLYLIDRATHTNLSSSEPVEFEKRISGFLDWSLQGIERRQSPRLNPI